MSWNYRNGDQWNSTTPKTRQGEEWVTVSGGGGGGGGPAPGNGMYSNDAYLLGGNPPTRSTTEYVSNYSGLQDALNSIGEDTRLVIDDGPHTGNWSFPATNHITLDGDGATLTRGDTGSQFLGGTRSGSEFSTSVSPSGSYSQGDGSITVSDTSPFSAGDIIRIYDDSAYLSPDMDANSGTTNGIGIMHVVESINGNDLVLEENLRRSWESTGSLEVNRVDYNAVDQRITGINFQAEDPGRNGGKYVLGFRCRRNLWVDNCEIHEGRNGLYVPESFGVRVDNVLFNELGNSDGGTDYPLDIVNGTHHWLITNCESLNGRRYAFKSGSGGLWWPCRNGRYVNCHAADTDQRRAFDQHPGSWDVDYLNCSSENCGFGRPRTTGWFSRGTEIINPGQVGYYGREAMRNVTISEERMTGSPGGRIYQFFVFDDFNIGDFEMRDCWAQPSGSYSNFFQFRHDGSGTATAETFTIDHVAVDDTWVDEDFFYSDTDFARDWDFGDTTFNTPSDGSTPAEYFANEFGW